MLYQKIPSGRFWIMPNDFFEKYKLNSRDFMVYCFVVFTFAFLMDKQYKSLGQKNIILKRKSAAFELVLERISSRRF